MEKRKYVVEFLTAEKEKPHIILQFAEERKRHQRKRGREQALIIFSSPSPAYTIQQAMGPESSHLRERTLRLQESAFPSRLCTALGPRPNLIHLCTAFMPSNFIAFYRNLISYFHLFKAEKCLYNKLACCSQVFKKQGSGGQKQQLWRVGEGSESHTYIHPNLSFLIEEDKEKN